MKKIEFVYQRKHYYLKPCKDATLAFEIIQVSDDLETGIIIAFNKKTNKGFMKVVASHTIWLPEAEVILAAEAMKAYWKDTAHKVEL